MLWRLNNKSAKVRQQAADLISRIAVVMMKCDQEQYMNHLGVILYENLGEEYPEVGHMCTHARVHNFISCLSHFYPSLFGCLAELAIPHHTSQPLTPLTPLTTHATRTLRCLGRSWVL